jgi:5-bromo-4-chloroindolyl phosphate hydrolysis protein
MDKEIEFSKYKNKIEKSLLKKAFGYNYKEVIEEYSVDDDGQRLTKKKVTTKNVPPDISAVKFLLEELNVSSCADLTTLTDDELKTEIKRAMDILDENYRDVGGEDGN